MSISDDAQRSIHWALVYGYRHGRQVRRDWRFMIPRLAIKANPLQCSEYQAATTVAKMAINALRLMYPKNA